jgi:hypothetical protein
MIDKCADMRRAQFAVAAELFALGWPAVFYSEVCGYPSPGDQWLAVIDLTNEMLGEIQIRFETPFKVDVDDDAQMKRLNRLFWAGCRTRRVLTCGETS